MDRYTYYALEFLERVQQGSKHTMEQFVSKTVLCEIRCVLIHIFSDKIGMMFGMLLIPVFSCCWCVYAFQLKNCIV